MARGFQVKAEDNVATLLADAAAGERVEVLGAAPSAIELREPVALGHKAALREIPAGEAVIKFGVPIGVATRLIRRGEWVHLQNCASRVDERSSTLDVATGAATDMAYE
ncbi:MAG: UxaA family hydrolase [Bryobacteraceae bacterium]